LVRNILDEHIYVIIYTNGYHNKLVTNGGAV
ncbi:unnamed protein product, partial [marine sediment metagenome]